MGDNWIRKFDLWGLGNLGIGGFVDLGFWDWRIVTLGD